MPGAGLFTPGPIHHFVQFRGQSSPVYLGTAVAAPNVGAIYHKLEVKNDIGGRSVPFQLVKDGEEWAVSTVLNRFDLSVCRAIQLIEAAGPGGAGDVTTLGTETGAARGTLTIGQTDYQLILWNTYAGTPSAGANAADLNPARGFSSANLTSYNESTAGTRVLEVSMSFRCLGVYDPTSRGFSNYTEYLTGFIPFGIN